MNSFFLSTVALNSIIHRLKRENGKRTLSVFRAAFAAISGSYLPLTALAEDDFAFALFVRAVVAFAEVAREAAAFADVRLVVFAPQFCALFAEVRDVVFAPQFFALFAQREVLPVVAMNFTSLYPYYERCGKYLRSERQVNI